MAIVALGAGFYAGLRMAAPDMRLAADAYYDGTGLYDIRVVSTAGLTDDDVAALRAVDGIEGVMPAYEADMATEVGTVPYTMRIHSLDLTDAQASDSTGGAHALSDDADYLNRPVLVSGSWPKGPGECVLALGPVMQAPVGLGDRVTILEGSQDPGQVLNTREYTIVGFVRSSYYTSFTSLGTTSIGNGFIQQYLYAPEGDFVHSQPYTEVYLTVAGAADKLSASPEYLSQVSAAMDRVNAIASGREQARLSQVQAQAQAGLDTTRAAYEQEREEAEARLAQGQQQLDATAAALSAQEEQLEAAAALGGLQAQAGAAASQLAQAQAELAAAQGDYEAALQSYNGQKASAEAGFADTEQKLADAQSEIDDMQAPAWYVMDRTKNRGAESFQSDATRVDQISKVFPLLFFLVAALVALTTMTRMVDEERTLIGTYKALGYGKARIASKYLIYAFLASGAGAALGIAVLSQVLPRTIFAAYGIMYDVPVSPTPIDGGLAALSATLGIGATLAATWAATVATLREDPAALMLPRAPKPGKRILLERIAPLWRRVSFSWKVTFRNIFRDKRRFVMTVIGVAGCSALLLTGLGLSDAINDIIDKQYNEITHYNTTVTVADGISDDDMSQVEAVLNDTSLVTGWTRVYEEPMTASASSQGGVSVSIVVPQDPDAFQGFLTMRERVGHAPLRLDDSSIIIVEKVADQLGLAKGDTLLLSKQDAMGNPTGEQYAFIIGGIMENYVSSFGYLSPACYKQVIGSGPDYPIILAESTDDATGRGELSDTLLAVGGVQTVSFTDATIAEYRKMLASLNSIVAVLLVSAAALAFVVLYNLTNINITERKREIATLKVLGFLPHEVDAYIFRETLLLTVIGALCGLVLGIFMESYVVVTAETDYVMFCRDIHPTSFLIAFALTLAYAVVVSLVMRVKLNRIQMVESLKSVE